LYKAPPVTRKEYEVLQLISNGCSSKKIAEHLHISFHTAETHRKNLLGKFEAANTAELMKKASKVFWFE
jgi:DNA-binding CsgD family transcriptional regulator